MRDALRGEATRISDIPLVAGEDRSKAAKRGSQTRLIQRRIPPEKMAGSVRDTGLIKYSPCLSMNF